MARQTKDIRFKDGEAEHLFRITQLPASQMFKISIKVGLMLIRLFDLKGVSPMEAVGNIAKLGAMKSINFEALGHEEIEEIETLFLCSCEHVHGRTLEPVTLQSLDATVTDFTILHKLAWEAVKLNVSFLSGGALGSIFQGGMTQAAEAGQAM